MPCTALICPGAAPTKSKQTMLENKDGVCKKNVLGKDAPRRESYTQDMCAADARHRHANMLVTAPEKPAIDRLNSLMQS